MKVMIIKRLIIVIIVFDLIIKLVITTMQTVHQCSHYQRKCHVESPCCKIYYACKLCHDEKYQFKKGCQIDRMEFDKVEHIKCLNCQQIQQPRQICSKCETKFGEYTCIKCRLYESNPQKVGDIFHCVDDCKMCRRGTKETVTHCFKCGYCVPNQTKNHKCFENIAKSNCPVCLQELLYSTKGYFPLRCGHLIHVECYQDLQSMNCPTCGMANSKMSRKQKSRMDRQLARTRSNLPKQVQDLKVNVLCNECLHKTMNTPFHFLGMKCEKCGTYNTKQI